MNLRQHLLRLILSLHNTEMKRLFSFFSGSTIPFLIFANIMTRYIGNIFRISLFLETTPDYLIFTETTPDFLIIERATPTCLSIKGFTPNLHLHQRDNSYLFTSQGGQLLFAS